MTVVGNSYCFIAVLTDNYCMHFCVDNSAKVKDINEITPQSNYVQIFSDGECIWEPRFDLSVTQCSIDITWFPFDEQTCDLVFESWLLQESILKINTRKSAVYLGSFLQPDGWYLVGACSRYYTITIIPSNFYAALVSGLQAPLITKQDRHRKGCFGC